MSWSSVKVQGIVLHVSKFREADRRYRALTSSYGKIDFVGRGAQKGLAKLASHLEPFAIVDLEIIRGKKSVTVISVERVERFQQIERSLEARLLATSSMNLLDRFTYEGEDDPALYDELLAWMNFLNKEQQLLPGRSTFLLGGFLLRCLTHLGYSIELSSCVGCKGEVREGEYKWHAGKGGLVCRNCIQGQPSEWFTARNVHESIIKLLRFARNESYEQLMKPHLKGDQIEEYAKVVQDLLYFHLPHRNTTPFWSGVMVDYELDLPQKQV